MYFKDWKYIENGVEVFNEYNKNMKVSWARLDNSHEFHTSIYCFILQEVQRKFASNMLTLFAFRTAGNNAIINSIKGAKISLAQTGLNSDEMRK